MKFNFPPPDLSRPRITIEVPPKLYSGLLALVEERQLRLPTIVISLLEACLDEYCEKHSDFKKRVEDRYRREFLKENNINDIYGKGEEI